MKRMMDALYGHCRLLVESRGFMGLMSIIILINPVAIFPQVVVAITAPSVEGIAAWMWYIFAAIQSALALNGIKNKDAALFISMAVSLLESLIIIATVHIRG